MARTNIDVLIAMRAGRRLIAVEAKDMAGSLTPSDLASRLATTFVAGIKKRSSGEKHARRAAWLVEHRAEVPIEVGLASWAVEGVFVTSRALPVGSVKGSRCRFCRWTSCARNRPSSSRAVLDSAAPPSPTLVAARHEDRASLRLDHGHGDPEARSTSEGAIAGDERASEDPCQRDVEAVVGADVVA